MLKISDPVGSLFSVDFTDKYNVISGDSATGKTYLRKLLGRHLSSIGRRCIQIDCDSIICDIIDILRLYKDDPNMVIIVDNVNTIMTKELELAIYDTKAETKIFIIHTFRNISFLACLQPGLYKLYMDSDKVLRTKRIGQL